MTLTQHLTLTGVAAAAVSPWLSAEELAFFAAGGVLIDVDHYLLYILRRRSLSIAGMFRYFEELQPIQKEIPYLGLCLFHTVDFFLAIIVAANLYPPLFAFLWGCLFHFCLDMMHLHREKILWIRAYFLLEHMLRRRAPGYPWY